MSRKTLTFKSFCCGKEDVQTISSVDGIKGDTSVVYDRMIPCDLGLDCHYGFCKHGQHLLICSTHESLFRKWAKAWFRRGW